jgi:hypothetical protein
MGKGRSEKSRQGRSNRARGGAAEREVCQLINALLPGVSAKRHLAQWRDKSQQDVVGVEGWMIQVKYCRELSRPAWWAALNREARAQGLWPALFYRKPGTPWTVLVRMAGEGEVFFEAIPEVWAGLAAADMVNLARSRALLVRGADVLG